MSRVRLAGVPDEVQTGVISVAGVEVPVVEPRWFDERQCCGVVLRYLAGESQGQPGDYTGCAAYCERLCRRQGGGALCAFHEPDEAAVWRKAAGWRLLVMADGSTAVTPAGSALRMAADLDAMVVGVAMEVKG